MFAASWSVYEVFSVISGLGLIVFAAIPGLSLRDRAVFLGGGAAMFVYGIYVASQDTGTFSFPVAIFLLPVLGLGYGLIAAYEWATEKWPNGMSDVSGSINKLNSGSSSAGIATTPGAGAPPVAPDPRLPPPPAVTHSTGTEGAAAPTWIAGASGPSGVFSSPAPPPPAPPSQAPSHPAPPPSTSHLPPPANPPAAPQPSGSAFEDDEAAPWWIQNQSDVEPPAP